MAGAVAPPKDLKTNEYQPMIYYQKPVLGPTGLKNNRTNEPLQVSFPSGSIGLGVPAVVDANANNNDTNSYVIIASGPEESMMDIRERRIIIFTFLLLAVVNIAITCLLYQDASMADLTLLNSGSTTDKPFTKLPETRSFLERINFGFTIFIIIYGAVSVYLENPLGLSIYALSVTLNFLLGLSAVPYFIYSLRYFLDTWMLYLALILRSKLVLSFLPFYVRDQHPRNN